MIDTKDLRLGNYVLFGDMVCLIEKIGKVSVKVRDTNNLSFKALPIELNYVPLDDRWLERLPMVKRPDKTDSYGGWLVRVHLLHWIRIKDNGWESGVGKIDLTYVHQLQNLYKVLTNSELY